MIQSPATGIADRSDAPQPAAPAASKHRFCKMTKLETRRNPLWHVPRLVPAALALTLLLAPTAWGQQTGPSDSKAGGGPAAETVTVPPPAPSTARPAEPDPTADRPFRPSEEISADQAVDFPYDI